MWVLPVQIRRLRRRSEVLPALLVMLEDGVCLSLVFLQVCLDVSVRKFSQIPSSFFSWVARDSSGRRLSTSGPRPVSSLDGGGLVSRLCLRSGLLATSVSSF